MQRVRLISALWVQDCFMGNIWSFLIQIGESLEVCLLQFCVLASCLSELFAGPLISNSSWKN